MSEQDRLVGILQALTSVREAARSHRLLHHLVGMAVLEASECLVQAGFAPDALAYLGVDEEIAYLVEVKRLSAERRQATSRGAAHLRLIGS
ncbi:MAG: hypothetical protein JOZ84_00085 [Methylobacteriaceae bacterium]|nr:hypothetical protein [Methylobacteriaceae bacterium]